MGGVVWETVTNCDSDMMPPEELELNSEEDPRQLYLGALFAPGAFLASTLVKTVSIFRRSVEREEGVSWDRLRAVVVSAVECEVQSSLAEYEVTDEDYVVASRAAWARCSCACQYRSAGLQPMGLVDSKDSTAVMLIRRELITWLRPVEALEQVVVTGGIGVNERTEWGKRCTRGSPGGGHHPRFSVATPSERGVIQCEDCKSQRNLEQDAGKIKRE